MRLKYLPVSYHDMLSNDKQKRKHDMKKQSGQAILEYIILVALIAMVGIPAFQYIGEAVTQASVDSAKKITNQPGARHSTQRQ